MRALPAPGTLLLLALFGALVLRAGTLLGLDTDHVLHLAYGRAILAARSPWLPDDPTVYTAAAPPILQEWLAEALFAVLERIFGAWGPVQLTALIGAVVPWALYRSTLRRTHSFWPALLAWTVGGAGIATGLLIRPHLFSVVGFLITYQLLDRARVEGRWRRVWAWLALTTVLWTNLHGGGVVILLGLLLAVFAACNWRQPGARWVPLVYALTLLNPWGAGLHRHTWAFLRSDGPRLAADMGPPDLASGTLWVLLAMALLLLLAVRRRFRPSHPTTLAVTGVTLAASCFSMRALPFLGIALAYLLPELLDGWLAEHPAIDRRSRALAADEPARSIVPWVLAALTLVPLGAVLPQPRPSGSRVPVAAIAWLGEHPEVARRRGYAGYDDAGFLLHARVVDRVYLHSLNANTPLALIDDHKVLQQGAPGWQALFARHQVSWALTRRDEPLSARLVAAGWRAAWNGEDRAVYVGP